MGFGCIVAGLLFLFNPNIQIYDVLPDCIGLLLIYRGLFAMSFSTEKLRDARGLLWKLVIVTAARTASILLIPGKSDSFTLLLVFSFGVLEAIYTIPFIMQTFDGFYDLGRRYDVKSVFWPVKDRKGQVTERAEKLKIYTVIFFVIKTAASVLPELTALDMQAAPSENHYIPMSRFKPLFYLFAGSIALVFGVIWLVRALRYVNGMRKDTKLNEGIAAHYKEAVLNDKGMFAAVQMKNVLLLFLLAAVAVFPMQLDGIGVFPSFIAAGLLVLALRILSRFDRLAWYGSVPAVLTSVLSVIGLVLQPPYFAEYEAMAARYITNAARLYKPIRTLGTLEFVFLLITFVYFAVILCRVFRKHAALVAESYHSPQYSGEMRAAEIMKSVYARTFTAMAGGGILLILRAASFTTAMYYPELWILHIVVSCLFVALVIYTVSGVNDQIYERLENKY